MKHTKHERFRIFKFCRSHNSVKNAAVYFICRICMYNCMRNVVHNDDSILIKYGYKLLK